ncbi:CheW domain-containing protein [Pseudomonas sp. 5P_3.1_Bac2]|uniref:CheW domain-containing protein n=1 Tax=Pseudomonas sp. 5P_3.1_Bac2 TaxID=2971617 RepID=UPI0021CA034E|nr:CheW domain-containing protein [Pseudomonas sp. 5P_3.1_Bac2]MCU1715971.1 chemotaxis protein CheW [Pseudomonas sp. 5P_3.1_Bac2]
MSHPLASANRTQLALQSYLDGLLQEAAVELTETSSQVLDEFEAAVLEEQVRDARLQPKAAPSKPLAEAPERPLVLPTVVIPPVALLPEPPAQPEPLPAQIEPPAPQLKELVAPAPAVVVAPEPIPGGQPDWAQSSFECLLFDVAGLTLAVPLVCLGSIYPLQDQELTPLFGQPDWFLGILPSQAGNLKVLDTARWVMPERYRDEMREGLQYVISVAGYEWGLAVHQVSRSIRLDPQQIKWRSHRTQRPWLAGTVIEHMCALVDVASLAEMIASGAAKRMASNQAH